MDAHCWEWQVENEGTQPPLISGYVIKDSDGRVQAQTFRTNRHDAWMAFHDSAGGGSAETMRLYRPQWKRQGFVCIPASLNTRGGASE